VVVGYAKRPRGLLGSKIGGGIQMGQCPGGEGPTEEKQGESPGAERCIETVGRKLPSAK